MNGISKPLHLDAMQGKLEQRSEPYLRYGERVTESLTPQGAKSNIQQPAMLDDEYCGAGVAR